MAHDDNYDDGVTYMYQCLSTADARHGFINGMAFYKFEINFLYTVQHVSHSSWGKDWAVGFLLPAVEEWNEVKRIECTGMCKV
jgi:hypothetical protein